MKHAWQALYSVARATAIEGLQQTVTLLLALTCTVLTALQPLVQLHVFGEPGRMTRDCGLAFLLVFGIFIVALTAGFTLAREIQDGTAATALAKPISRTTFFLGKFFGSCAVAAAFAWCETGALLLAFRTAENHVLTAATDELIRDPACGLVSIFLPVLALGAAAFVSARTGRRMALWFFGLLAVLEPVALLVLGLWARDGSWLGVAHWCSGTDLRILSLVLPLFLLLCVFAALATAFSTRLPTGPSVALSFLLLFLGFLADATASSGGFFGRALAVFVPDVQAFWLADSLASGGSVGAGLQLRTLLYAVLYGAAILSVGLFSFRTKDL